MSIGFSLGLIIKLITTKKYKNRQKNLRLSEVVIIINCNDNQLGMVKDMLWEHNAVGVGKLSLGNNV
jgi:hypothetical protein